MSTQNVADALSPGLKLRKNRRRVWRPLGVTGLVVLVIWILVAALAPVLAPHDPLGQQFDRFLSPSGAHWFGTDELGRDVLSRVVYGARVTIPLSLLLVVCSLVIGAVVGAAAGYYGGWLEMLVMRTADLVFAFPAIILAMAVVAALGADLTNAVLAIVVVSWPSYARVARGLVLSSRNADYVLATRLLGASGRRSLLVDVTPNVAGPILVLATLDVGNAALLLSGLSFLGLGARPPAAEWGAMVAAGASNFDKWWLGLFPGLAILTLVLAVNFLGDTLRDMLDPRTARAVIQ
ncbi:peptide/nickel transport system permease protein [Actinoplanes tereljensis]|uniref:Cytochrome c550 n=1 Tax=Paractinoplanes tereljensis TaxID=571912 RepID=A0A919TU49_9ACTN|nr:ABC transporter permease [Actinoplanes tereljensis]GIF23253.1 cytochrome c550 [Actinoplanes tereljensis]